MQANNRVDGGRPAALLGHQALHAVPAHGREPLNGRARTALSVFENLYGGRLAAVLEHGVDTLLPEIAAGARSAVETVDAMSR